MSIDGLEDEAGEVQGWQFHSAILFLFGAVGLPLLSSALASRFSNTWQTATCDTPNCFLAAESCCLLETQLSEHNTLLMLACLVKPCGWTQHLLMSEMY